MRIGGSSELALVERVARRVGFQPGGRLVLGIGDDCAIYRIPRGSEDLLFTTDLLLENVHFRRKTHPAQAVGHKALARGLSDIAAMGGEPRFCLLSMALPGWADSRWVDGFYRGLLKLSKTAGAPLMGGDLARSDRLALDVVVCGSVPKGTALLRSGARPGDSIWVSGRLGGSSLGLATGSGKAWKRHLWPQPRIALGRYLRARLKASSAMDLSDGISLDLHRLAKASGVEAELDEAAIPVFPDANLDQALHGGEDYELLFTLSPTAKPPRSVGGIPLTRIGSIRSGKPGRVTLSGRLLPRLGYDHFSRR